MFVAAVIGALTCVGCGQRTTTVDESDTQSTESYQAEMEAMEAEMTGDKPPTTPPPAEQPAEGEGEKEEKE
jgi:hypothetical protein